MHGRGVTFSSPIHFPPISFAPSSQSPPVVVTSSLSLALSKVLRLSPSCDTNAKKTVEKDETTRLVAFFYFLSFSLFSLVEKLKSSLYSAPCIVQTCISGKFTKEKSKRAAAEF
jgi:hypothetical protein